MKRKNAIGLFWEDKPKPPLPKRTPPEPTWLSPDYLPGLEEALAFNPENPSFKEIYEMQESGEALLFDLEVFPNYFLAAFKGAKSGRLILFEITPSESADLNLLRWIAEHFLLVGFNSIAFDLPMLACALAGHTNEQLAQAVGKLIGEEIRPAMVLRSMRVKPIVANHIDLIEVCPLSGSLKLYGGRLHCEKLQDLPFPPDTVLSPEQIAIVRHYCVNDLAVTGLIYETLREQIELRKDLGRRYQIDLRSKSDAQIAEAVIAKEIERLTGRRPLRPEILPGTSYQYAVPGFVSFRSDEFRRMLSVVSACRFVVGQSGAVETPEELKELAPTLNGGAYRMGIGGLHSSETTVCHYSDDDFQIVDRDVASYYPAIILNLGLYPKHLGATFLQVYKTIVDRRLAAKKAGNKVEADSLKITINGSFGKFGSKWSCLYSPDLLIQVTLTGQLSLLMLIERLELAGVRVLSANTDGIVFRSPRARQSVVDEVVATWERDTGFVTEATEYAAILSRDVNSYFAVKADGKTKAKGALFNAWAKGVDSIWRFHNNPSNAIVAEALTAFLSEGTDIVATIRECRDIRKFLTVRTVKGGAVKDGQFLGKVVRWYYGTNATGEIVYAASGNKVPLSENCVPCAMLPKEFPDDVDFSRYETIAFQTLKEIGFDF